MARRRPPTVRAYFSRWLGQGEFLQAYAVRSRGQSLHLNIIR